MRLLICLLVVLIVGCNRSPVAKPDNLIDKEIMADILYDVSLLQVIQTYPLENGNITQINVEEYIFNKYGIDSIMYNQNQKYYASMPEDYEDIYKRVKEKIKKAQSEVGNGELKEKSIQPLTSDSDKSNSVK